VVEVMINVALASLGSIRIHHDHWQSAVKVKSESLAKIWVRQFSFHPEIWEAPRFF
jgi:hypothetical protein